MILHVQSKLLSEFPSFNSVALLNVIQYTDPRFANFTSVLTANLVQLQQQNIDSVSCGDPGTESVLLINVYIQEQVVPNNPQISDI